MNFKDRYTTKILKAEILVDEKISAEEKAKEEKKIEIPEETFLQAEMILSLINKLEHLRMGFYK